MRSSCPPRPSFLLPFLGLTVLLGLAWLPGCGAPPRGGLVVEVQPPEAKLFLEGEYQGTGSFTRKDLEAPFEYSLRIDPPKGWRSLVEKVGVRPGETTRLQLTLETVAEGLEQAAKDRADREETGWDGDPTLPLVRLETNLGELEVRLFEDQAPNTVANFVALIRRGFYDGTLFHRVIDGFMVQGGDPLSRDSDPENDGKGGPGYQFPDEFSVQLHSGPGVLSMANSGPNTNGSQFFLTLASAPHLNGRHTVFGVVTKGLSVLESIGRVPTDRRDRPVVPVQLIRAEVLSARDHPYVPTDERGQRLPLPESRRN